MSSQSISRQPQSKEEQHRRAEQDYWGHQLRISRGQLRAAKWLTYITAIGIVLAIFSLRFVYEGLIATHKAIEIANRAWIAPRGASIDWEHTSKDFTAPTNRIVAIKVEYENIGKTPAFDATIGYYIGDWTGPAINKGGSTNFPIMKNDVCKPPSPGNPPIWPSTGRPLDYQFVLMTDQNFLQNFNLMLSGKRTLYIKGCISYITFGKEHRSAFCYYAKPVETIGPSGERTLDEQGNVVVGTTMSLPFAVCPNAGENYAD